MIKAINLFQVVAKAFYGGSAEASGGGNWGVGFRGSDAGTAGVFLRIALAKCNSPFSANTCRRIEHLVIPHIRW
ncbi:hypothetical protein HYPGJ_20142 [Hyphomicrobium sp. GJ21]|uniref:hypothetical protein n=1 Tax=Hyphomicrobium sp. GJ21 TaxID=113574 RepID=UPI000622B4F0|nr:hypothetical protein [Hyphomicrobium sp. GJ21]CEJ84189.1 hypothetical protein HYPGJ_20142 [Hyphomicrobium sp. GJ21]